MDTLEIIINDLKELKARLEAHHKIVLGRSERTLLIYTMEKYGKSSEFAEDQMDSFLTSR